MRGLFDEDTVKRFDIVIPREDGGVEIYPMKEWLRQHPQHIPPGLDATMSTSHQLRSGLRRMGWSVQETPTDVRLILPGTPGAAAMVETVLGEEAEIDQIEAPDASFGLESQLRDFIAQNLGVVEVKGRDSGSTSILPAMTASSIQLPSARLTSWPPMTQGRSTY